MKPAENQSIQQVDIKKIFYDKNPRLARLLPAFVYRYLKRIAHEDYINKLLREYGHLQGLDFANAMIKEFNVQIVAEGEENLPKEGRFIFVSNHPLGGFDGQIIMHLVARHYGGFKFLVNDILMNLRNLGSVFIPVNKHGRQGIELAGRIDEAFRSDDQILTFPAGYVSRRIKGQIVDLEWQKNFITKARQYQRDVIPIHMGGRNSEFFYRLGTIRKKFGIKANIEMLFLIDETYQHRNKTIVVKFGQPIPWQTFDHTKKPIEWAHWVKEKVYLLDGISSIPL